MGGSRVLPATVSPRSLAASRGVDRSFSARTVDHRHDREPAEPGFLRSANQNGRVDDIPS